ncbi:type II toxin-antitoxin system HicA family toxin [Candidatus Woesearchaeota archaeon]|nr:type II toxin-antitoxin system HicA family toxin [Candidatus Woesearchaeota archaeon]
MGEKLPRLSGKEVIKALSKAGFKPIRQSGSHVFLLKETPENKTTVVPLHKEIDKGTLLEIIRQAGLKRDEFIKLI